MSNDRVVFVIDDDPIVLNSTAALLQSFGWPVDTAASAEEFLANFQPHRIACLLLDVRLPGISGVELHDKLRADGIHIPTILISGHASTEIGEAGTADSEVRILEKPVDAHQLLEIVSGMIGTS